MGGGKNKKVGAAAAAGKNISKHHFWGRRMKKKVARGMSSIKSQKNNIKRIEMICKSNKIIRLWNVCRKIGRRWRRISNRDGPWVPYPRRPATEQCRPFHYGWTFKTWNWVQIVNKSIWEKDCILCRFESQSEIVSLVFGFELIVIKCVRVKVMDEGAECQTVVPAGAEIFYLHVLHTQAHEAQSINQFVC